MPSEWWQKKNKSQKLKTRKPFKKKLDKFGEIKKNGKLEDYSTKCRN